MNPDIRPNSEQAPPSEAGVVIMLGDSEHGGSAKFTRETLTKKITVLAEDPPMGDWARLLSAILTLHDMVRDGYADEEIRAILFTFPEKGAAE